MKLKEDRLQKEIMRIYKMLYKKDCLLFAVPNGGSRNAVEAVKLKETGTLSGVSDLILLAKSSRAIFIEVKSSTGRQSPTQKEFEARVNELGFEYFLIKSTKEFIELIEDKIYQKNNVKIK